MRGMGAILVASTEPRSGKTTVAAGLAHILLYEGRRVALIRLSDEGDLQQDAVSDARLFASIFGAEASDAQIPLDEAARKVQAFGADVTAIVEAPAGIDLRATADRLGASVLLVTRPGEDALASASSQVAQLGDRFGAIVVTGVAQRLAIDIAEQLRSEELPVLAVIPEDRQIGGPSIQAVIEALDARVIFDGADRNESVSNLQIGTIGSDPGMSYFGRIPDKAVITRFDKTDIMLSALNTATQLIVICGGKDPSGYVIDRASNNRDLTLIVCDSETMETVNRVSALYQNVPFTGERKVERIGELLQGAIQDAALLAKLVS